MLADRELIRIGTLMPRSLEEVQGADPLIEQAEHSTILNDRPVFGAKEDCGFDEQCGDELLRKALTVNCRLKMNGDDGYRHAFLEI